MKLVIMTIMLSGFISCATTEAKNSLSKRGISTDDQVKIMTQFDKYNTAMARARVNTGLGGSISVAGSGNAVDTNIQTILCKCYKTLGEKCLNNGKGVSDKTKSLWIKGHAAKLAHEKYQTGLDDKDMCSL